MSTPYIAAPSTLQFDEEAAGAAESVAAMRANAPTEGLVLKAFEDVFARRDLAAADDFFRLEGSSLMALRLLTKLRDATGLELPLRLLFEYPSVAALAGAIDLLTWADAAVSSPAAAGREQIVI